MTNYSLNLDLAFAALSNPTRRAIIARLCRGAASVGQLAEPIRMAMPTVLQHIRVLERSGLIESTKNGRVRTCAVRAEAVQATENWLASQREVWERRLDRFDSYVTDLHGKEKRLARRLRNS